MGSQVNLCQPMLQNPKISVKVFFPRRPNHLVSHWCSDAWWKEWITRTFSTLKRTFWWIPWQLTSIGIEFENRASQNASSLPTTHFQVQTVSFRTCTFCEHEDSTWQLGIWRHLLSFGARVLVSSTVHTNGSKTRWCFFFSPYTWKYDTIWLAHMFFKLVGWKHQVSKKTEPQLHPNQPNFRDVETCICSRFGWITNSKWRKQMQSPYHWWVVLGKKRN